MPTICSSTLAVAYQPQILTGSHRLSGVEALVRWHDPERGALPTLDFIRTAEDAGAIGLVTDYVLREAMTQVIAWQRSNLVRDLSLAVNISSLELRDGALGPAVDRRLRTGYSSLSWLRHLPVHAVKIDRTFVDDIEHRDAGALARAIILMARSLELSSPAKVWKRGARCRSSRTTAATGCRASWSARRWRRPR